MRKRCAIMQNETPPKSESPSTPMTGHEPDDGPLWTAEDVAEYLRLKPGTVRKMAREGELPAIRLKRSWRFRKADIDRYIIATQSKMSFVGE